MSDTIAALATSPGRAAVAVIRISGARTREVLEALAGRLPPPRSARLRRLRDPLTGGALDQALTLWFPAPASFTGEDQAELHVHGGRASIAAVLERLFGLGVRQADPGEFTRRAFQNCKLDLAQAEAVADLVDAETEAQRRQALAQLEGAMSRRYASWRDGLLEALSLLEAQVDFPDEEIPEAVAARARAPLEALVLDIDQALADERGRQVREGFRIALIGAPNAGKSSLLNVLLGRNAAIVTDIAGTTRDVVEAPITLEGYSCILADTAGLREAEGAIEAEGVRRALAWAEGADLRLWVVDRSGDQGAWGHAAPVVRPGDMLLLNKADVPAGADADTARDLAEARGLLILSTQATPEGAAELLRAIGGAVVSAMSGAGFPAATRARHRALLQEAVDHLRRALDALSGPAELASEDVRLAARALARLAGRIDPEAVLERVFASFCIGK